MDAINYQELARNGAVAAIESQGFSINVGGYDKALIDKVVNRKGRIGPEVKCCGESGSKEPAKLVTIETGDRLLVGFCAIKMCDMKGRSLDAYLWDTYRSQYAGGAAPFHKDDLPGSIRDVSGKVAYVGDFWLDPTRRIDITALAILALSISHRDFDAEWSYFFTRHRNYWRGLGARYLACRNVPFAIDWLVDVEHRRKDDCLYINRRDEAYRTERKYVQHLCSVNG